MSQSAIAWDQNIFTVLKQNPMNKIMYCDKGWFNIICKYAL